MRKIVLTFGLLSGLILSAMMAITMPFHDRIGFERGMILGYTTMVAASLLIYFGVRRYRDQVGAVSFGRAFVVGALIMCVANLCYVATWEVIYPRFASDYMEKYAVHELDKARAAGATPADLEAKRAEFAHFAELYKSPPIRAGMTFLEPLPVGLLAALITAGVLRRRRRDGDGSVAAATSMA
jgi:hypothetical protein